MLGLSPADAPPVLRVSGRTGAGVEELWAAIAAFPLRRGASRSAGELLERAQEVLARRFAGARAAGNGDLTDLLSRWQSGALDPEEAAAALLRLLGSEAPGS
jgi:hypothetical protein